jgi:GeoRSP system PqqD family protein
MTETVTRNPNIVWRDEPDQREAILQAQERGEDVSDQGWVILVDAGEMHELNLIAGEIWCLADGSRDARAVALAIAERYEAPFEEILADVEEFVSDSVTRGWLRTEQA